MEAPLCGTTEKVSVLLVHHEAEFLTDQTVKLLEGYKYKVTEVMAPAAMSMFSKEKKKMDAMIINATSPDSQCFELLAQAVALNIIVLIVYDELNEFFVKKALDNGAYICLKKPLVEQTVTFLWQFVWREKLSIKRIETKGEHINVDDNNYFVEDEEQTREKNISINTEEQSNNSNVVSNGKPKLRRKRSRKSTKDINEENKIIMRKDCLKWTDDLRVKFTEAVEQLGEGRCFPSTIREVMNMPGLTIKQISSRLQKFRSKDEKLQEEREYICHESSSGSQQRSSYDTSLERTKRRNCEKYGKMPRLQTNVPNQTLRVSEFPPVNTNNIFSSSTQQQLHHPQLQVQPNYLNTFLSAQNDVGGGQQQRGPLFGTMGPVSPFIGSTNYRSLLEFNSGNHHDYGFYHHTQNDQSLDLNTAYVTTTLSDIDVQNATINGLGATNANFQQDIDEQNIFDPSNIVAASDANAIEGSDPNEWQYWDAFVNYNPMDDISFQNSTSPSATLPNEHGSGRDTEGPYFNNSKFPDE